MKFSYKTWLYSQEIVLSNSSIPFGSFQNGIDEKICINKSLINTDNRYSINGWVDVNKFKSYYEDTICDKLLNISKNNKEEIYNLTKNYICKTSIYIDIKSVSSWSWSKGKEHSCSIIIEPLLTFSFLTLKGKMKVCFDGERAIRFMNDDYIVDDTSFTKDLSSLREFKKDFLKSDLEDMISILEE